MVLDGRKDEKPQKYWLRVQELLGGDSPLIILTNLKRNLGDKIPFKELKMEFPNIAEHVLVNLKSDKKGLDKLKNIIEFSIRNLPHLKREKLPKKWVEVRNKLEKIKYKNHISLGKFREICKKVGIKDQGKQDYIGEYLHDLGANLTFQRSSYFI